jgi:hypothetical protein
MTCEGKGSLLPRNTRRDDINSHMACLAWNPHLNNILTRKWSFSLQDRNTPFAEETEKESLLLSLDCCLPSLIYDFLITVICFRFGERSKKKRRRQRTSFKKSSTCEVASTSSSLESFSLQSREREGEKSCVITNIDSANKRFLLFGGEEGNQRSAVMPVRKEDGLLALI